MTGQVGGENKLEHRDAGARRYRGDAGDAGDAAHHIRHTTAMYLLRAGNDVNMVSYWLGHADINTTHIYVEIDMEMKRRMLQKAAAPLVKNDLPWQRPDVLQWLATLGKSPRLCTVKH